MKKILVIGTGGTISCIEKENGFEPFYNTNELLEFIDIEKSDLESCDLLSIDSSNVQPETWKCMAEHIHNNRNTYSGFVICHGTDTMAYSACALTYMLRGISVPIVFTGSQLPIDQEGTDAKENLRDSIIAARQLAGGVYVCFNGVVMWGEKCSKLHSIDFEAFKSVNAPIVGVMEEGSLILKQEIQPSPISYEPQFEMESNIAVIRMFPGLQGSIFRYICENDMKGVVIECFGVGGFPNNNKEILDGFRMLAEREIPVVVVTQCIYGGVKLDVYEVSSQIVNKNIISGGEMTVEAAMVKLMWALKGSAL